MKRKDIGCIYFTFTKSDYQDSHPSFYRLLVCSSFDVLYSENWEGPDLYLYHNKHQEVLKLYWYFLDRIMMSSAKSGTSNYFTAIRKTNWYLWLHCTEKAYDSSIVTFNIKHGNSFYKVLRKALPFLFSQIAELGDMYKVPKAKPGNVFSIKATFQSSSSWSSLPFCFSCVNKEDKSHKKLK